MKGDFSRFSFDPSKHFTRVLQQQGRVQLDADWNEQAAIFLHYTRALTADLIGAHGGPADERNADGMVSRRNLGFAVVPYKEIDNQLVELTDAQREQLKKELVNDDFVISKGRYYVQGLLAESEGYYGLYNQPDYPWSAKEKLQEGRYLMYLDVWEHHISHVEDESIREVALEGADTATRAKLVWQVKAKAVDKNFGGAATNEIENKSELWQQLEADFYPPDRGWLKVIAKYEGKNEPCVSSPQAAYRGLENQLYRVEIYQKDSEFLAKWSRDNASTATKAQLLGNLVKVENPRGFVAGQWLEITTNKQDLRGRAGPLFQIKKVEGNELFLDDPRAELPEDSTDEEFHELKVRRWDGVGLTTKESNTQWQVLADGIKIQFQPPKFSTANRYATGDYWVIPVRTATGTVEWPENTALPPHGIDHYYAPLALIDTSGEAGTTLELRRAFAPLAIDL